MLSIRTGSKFCRLVMGLNLYMTTILHNFTSVQIQSKPNDKTLGWSKLKAFADDNLIVVKMLIYVLDRKEIKGNAGYRQVLLFPQCFRKYSL